MVCKPNELAKIERGVALAELSDTKRLQRDFWQAVRELGEERQPTLSFRKPRPQHWYPIAIGRSGMYLSLTTQTTSNRLGCELYISGAVDAKSAFDQLEAQRSDVEAELGELERMRLPNKSACRIVKRTTGDVSDRALWPELTQWCVDEAALFHRVFGSRVQELDLDTPRDDEDEDPQA